MKHVSQFRMFHRTLVFLAAVVALRCLSQPVNSSTQKTGCLSGLETQLGSRARYRALREFEDPNSHQHWLLIRDQRRATGPALLVKKQPAACALSSVGKQNPESQQGIQGLPIPVIRAGDRIVLLEHTAVSDAELEATALQAAAVGDPLTVRLKFGGHMVRAIAAATGYATVGSGSNERLP